MPTKTHYIDGDNYQLRQVIFNSTPKAIEQAKSFAQQFKGKTEEETCKKIFDFLKNKVTYKMDGNHQKVKLPSALLREGDGDCKSYSVFTGAVLSNLGIPWSYVLTSYSDDPTPTHIYVVTEKGCIIDAVWGKFNSEKPAKHKYKNKVDMKISTISGIRGYSNSTPTTKKVTQQLGPYVGGCDPSNEKGINGPVAFIWFRDTKGREVTTGEAIEWRAKQVTLSLPREIVLQLFKNNAGGISTMLNNVIFKTTPTYYTIPQEKKTALAKEIEQKRVSLGVPKLTDAQKNQIFNVSVTLPASSSGALTIPTNANQMAQQSTNQVIAKYESLFGKGSYAKWEQYINFKNAKEEELTKQYTVYPSTKARKKWGEFKNTWFWKGGNPWDLDDAVKEGARKSPKGKDFNYIIRLGMTRGIKAKDFGLLIRAIMGVLFGSTFDLNSKDVFVLNKGKGIGVIDWVAISSAISGIASILATLFGLFTAIFPPSADDVPPPAGSDPNKTQEENELDKYLTNGWMYKDDAISMNAPEPFLEEKTIAGSKIVKVDEKWMKEKFGDNGLLAGFGNIAIPLLIGATALIALNTKK